jgi:hypothetical protein
LRDFDEKILLFLKEAGEDGLSVSKLAQHVFNASNNFFEPLDFKEVHAYVGRYLLRQSKSQMPLVISTGVRGHYRLNPVSPEVQQLMLLFTEDEECNKVENYEDQSLSLFDFD